MRITEVGMAMDTGEPIVVITCTQNEARHVAQMFGAEVAIVAPDVPARFLKMTADLEHWRHEVGKLHSQVARLSDENAQLIAANAALVVRNNAARTVVAAFMAGPNALRSVASEHAARAWLAGEVAA